NAAQVTEDVARLLLDARAVVRECRILPRLRRHAGLVVGGDLARRVERLADEDALAIVRHGRRRAGASDDAPLGARLHRPEIDLDAAAGNEEAAHLHRGARRGRRKELLPYLVEVEEVV